MWNATPDGVPPVAPLSCASAAWPPWCAARCSQATCPDPARLAALRPAVAVRPRPAVAPLYRRLAPVTLATVLLALGLLFGRGAPPFAPAVFAGGTPTQTATQTQTPTATLAAAGGTTAPTFIAEYTAAPQPAATPQP